MCARSLGTGCAAATDVDGLQIRVSFAILIIVLLFKPTGIFKGNRYERYDPHTASFPRHDRADRGDGHDAGLEPCADYREHGLISAIMALGVNLQWGFAGLFNIGIMGFVALGGWPLFWSTCRPWARPGLRAGCACCSVWCWARLRWWRRSLSMRGCRRTWGALAVLAVLVVGFILYRAVFDPAVTAVEAVSPASTGYLGGLGLPVLISWPVGGVLAAGAAWIIGKTALGLRSDYLAIATLGIAEIIIAVMKNEDWLARASRT